MYIETVRIWISMITDQNQKKKEWLLVDKDVSFNIENKKYLQISLPRRIPMS